MTPLLRDPGVLGIDLHHLFVHAVHAFHVFVLLLVDSLRVELLQLLFSLQVAVEVDQLHSQGADHFYFGDEDAVELQHVLADV